MDLIPRARVAHTLRDRTRLLPFLVALTGYAIAGVTVPMLLLFSGGRLLPKTVDDGPHLSPWVAVPIDLVLIALFGLQHSGMARPSFKAWITRRVPEALERTVYIFMVCVVVWLLMLAWQPIPQQVWSVDGTAGLVLDFTFWLGVALVYAATLLLDHFHLLGLRQAYREYVIRIPDATADRLQIHGPYRLVRHPLMTGLLLTFWAASEMTVGHVLWAGGLTGYILVGTVLEERDLLARFGNSYRVYAARVPAFFPSPVRALRRTPPRAETGRSEDDIRSTTESDSTPWSSTTPQ